MKNVVFGSLLLLALFSCKKSDPVSPNQTNGGNTKDTIGTVYAAGFELSATTSKNVATYWRGATAVRLTDGTKDAFASGITMVGNDVYVCGYEATSSNTAMVKYWKNGVAVNLTDGIKAAYASSIAISGNDVYVAGHEFNAAGKSVAKYWKNGTAVNLSDGTFNATAKGIGISGTDIYITGNEFTATGSSIAKYWKNGVAVNLSNGTANNFTNSIAINGSDVHVVGSTSALSIAERAYWKNGVFTSLPGTTSGEANSVVVSQGNVYVGGSIGQKATYWKDGTAFPLENNFSANEYVNSIFVLAGKVYCGGYRSYFGSGGIATIWSFGKSTQLASYASRVNSIYVVN